MTSMLMHLSISKIGKKKKQKKKDKEQTVLRVFDVLFYPLFFFRRFNDFN